MDEQLKQLVMQVKHSPPLSEERQQAIKELVAKMLLRSHSIFPSLRGQSHSETQIAIYQALQQQVNHDIEQNIDAFDPQNSSAEQWTSKLRNRVFPKVLNETYLQQLALEAQKYKPLTQEWQYSIKALTNAILLSNKLLRKGTISEDVYKEATNELWVWVYQNLNNYEPSKGKFMAWVNYRFDMILRKTKTTNKDPFIKGINSKIIRTKYQLGSRIRVISQEDLRLWWKLNKFIPKSSLSEQISLILLVLFLLSQLMAAKPLVADALLFEIAKQSLPISAKLTDATDKIENIPQSEAEESLSEQIRQYLQADPNQLLQKHVRGHPEATFQVIALQRLEGKTWKEISKTLKVGIPALSNFFQRHLQKIAPEIRKYIQH